MSGEIREGNPLLLSKLFWTAFSLVIGTIIDNNQDEIPSIEWFIHILSN